VTGQFRGGGKQRNPMEEKNVYGIPNCVISFAPVQEASKEIIDSIKHQIDHEPISMGEYIASQLNLECRDPTVIQSQVLSNETQWLLDKSLEISIKKDQEEKDQKHVASTVLGSTFTLTNTILGSGTLSVPFAIASSGWLLGNIIMFSIALITRYSVYLLLSASDRAGIHCAKTYESIGHFTMGNFGSRLAEFTFIFGGFGTLVSYFIFITDLFSTVLQVSNNHKWIITVICMLCVILPLSLNRRIGKLRLASVLAILSITYVVAFVLIAFCIISSNTTTKDPTFIVGGGPSLNQLQIQALRFDTGSVYTVTLLIAAFACHNTALPVYEELQNRSLQRMDRAVIGAISIAFLLYEVIGLFGYLQFGAHTKDNILLNFDAQYIQAYPSILFPLLIGRTCMGLALLLTAPIAMWPFRSCLLSVYLRLKNDGVQTPSHAATYKEHAYITLGSQILILLCSIFVPSVKIPLSIVGSVSGSLLIFIMPSLFYMLLSPFPVLSKHHTGPLLMLTTGICVGVLGLSLTLYKIYKEHF
jgi:amino acid permease